MHAKNPGNQRWSLASGSAGTILLLALGLGLGLALPLPASATHTDGSGNLLPHATIKIWSPTATSPSFGDDPTMTVADPYGLTGHVVSGSYTLTVVTVYENTNCPGGPCGVAHWNPATGLAKCRGYSSGAMTGVDVSVADSTAKTGPGGTTYGPGDTWLFKSSFRAAGSVPSSCGGACPLSVHFPSSDTIRSWEAGDISSGAVDQATGEIWYTASDSGGVVGVFDPATNVTKRWTVGGRPRDIEIDSSGKALATVGCTNQIVRVDPATNTVTEWAVPGGGLQCGFEPFSQNPDGVDLDSEGRLWFAEALGDEVGRLNPATNEICEYKKVQPSTGINTIDEPQNVGTSGSGDLLQTFFSEAAGNAVGIVTQVEAAGTSQESCTTVTPSVTTVTPAVFTLTPLTRTLTPSVKTITPSTFDVEGLDGVPGSGATTTPGPDGIAGNADDEVIPGILRFPMPAGSGASRASGMTQVALPNTVFGSLIGSEQWYQVSSGAIIAPPPPCNDADGDGVCDSTDNCPAIANRDQADGDGDGLGDLCDNCPSVANADQANADGDEFGDVCDIFVDDAENDVDGDGVSGEVDACPDTAASDLDAGVPSKSLGTNRWADLDGDGVFDTVAPRGGGTGPGLSFAIEDTAGCNCAQIIEAQSLGKGHVKFGCSISAMEDSAR